MSVRERRMLVKNLGDADIWRSDSENRRGIASFNGCRGVRASSIGLLRVPLGSSLLEINSICE